MLLEISNFMGLKPEILRGLRGIAYNHVLAISRVSSQDQKVDASVVNCVGN